MTLESGRGVAHACAMKQILPTAVLLLAACSPRAAEAPPASVEPAAVADTCVPVGKSRADLDALKAVEFEIADDAERQAFAKAIVACLASPDPSLRDGIAYEALTHMLRAKQLTPETMKALLADLEAKLEGPEGEGFVRPFAVLALSEVARADRIEAYLSDEELAALLRNATAYLTDVRDYRGFDEKEGWRHGVAHGSDLLMQLALNPRTGKEMLNGILSAVGSQVAPAGHSYIAGEGERLARPVLFAAARGAKTEAEWSDWLLALATPPDHLADKLFASSEGLAWRHDTMAFLNAIYMNVTLGADKADDVMLKGLDSALKAMP